MFLVGVRFDGKSMGLWCCTCVSLRAAEYGEARVVPAFLTIVRIVQLVQVDPENVGVFQLHEVSLVRRKDSVEPSCDVSPIKRSNGGLGALEG